MLPLWRAFQKMVFKSIGNTVDTAGVMQPRVCTKKTKEEKQREKDEKDALWGDIWMHRDLLFNGALEIAKKYNK